MFQYESKDPDIFNSKLGFFLKKNITSLYLSRSFSVASFWTNINKINFLNKVSFSTKVTDLKIPTVDKLFNKTVLMETLFLHQEEF